MKRVGKVDVATTASEARDVLLLLAAELAAGYVLPERAKEINNTYGKIAKLAALQIDFAAVNKVKAKCAFVSEAE